MAKHNQTVLLVNTGSRKGKELLRHAEKSLRTHGIALTRTHALDDPGLIDQAVQQAVDEGIDLLIVGSGDGTISEVVDHLAYRDTVLGYIPLGTSNNFARSLGIPLDLDSAIDVIAHGKVVDVAHDASATWKQWVGRLAYAAAGLRALVHHRSFAVAISADGRQYEYHTHQIVIANGRFHGGTLIAADASIDNHSLIIFHLGDTRRLQLLRSLILFALKRPRTLREGNFIVTTEATITTRPPRRLELDGEIKATTPVEASIAPGALKVMGGPGFRGGLGRSLREFTALARRPSLDLCRASISAEVRPRTIGRLHRTSSPSSPHHSSARPLGRCRQVRCPQVRRRPADPGRPRWLAAVGSPGSG